MAPLFSPSYAPIQLAAPRTTVWTVGQPVATVPGWHAAPCSIPLEPTTEARWYVVRNMHRAVLEARVLPPGTDLKRALVAAMLEHIDAGWQLGEFSSTGAVFFCIKGVERRQVEITPSDPGRVSTRTLETRAGLAR